MKGSTSLLMLIARSRVLFLISRYASSRSIEGVQATFDETSARNDFDRWSKNLW